MAREIERIAKGEAEKRAVYARQQYPHVNPLSVFDARADFLRRSGAWPSKKPYKIITSEEANAAAKRNVSNLDEEIRSLGSNPVENPIAESARERRILRARRSIEDNHIVLPPSGEPKN